MNKKGYIIVIIILSIISVSALGYITYDKIFKKDEVINNSNNNKDNDKKDDNKEDNKTDDNKDDKKDNDDKTNDNKDDTKNNERKNDTIKTTYGEFVVDYNNNKIIITSDKNVYSGETQEATIANEKIKKAIFYGTIGGTIGGKYALILTESGNMYINKYEEADKYPKMEFIKLDTSMAKDFNFDLKSDKTDISSIENIGMSCGFTGLRIVDNEHEALYGIDMTCDDDYTSINTAKINFFNSQNTTCQVK